MYIISLFIIFMGINKNVDFEKIAEKYNLPQTILEGICKYESDTGRVKHYLNKNKTWDIGLCMNHRGKSVKRPKIPGDVASTREAAKELSKYRRVHNKFCVHMLKNEGKCGKVMYGKFRGVKNCKRPHFWWEHYNHGYRVLGNDYGQKVKCYMDNGFKKCKRKRWRNIPKPAAHRRTNIK